ncbi:unnamed protein product [Brassica oleracea var. botrytis]|uniref:(rape) hypothetical protein n=1 Tax=Brassica napus TaxID=3708 RepID=A0A816R9E7_BRANA|nr:unnamed protein product [Brassica napus]
MYPPHPEGELSVSQLRPTHALGYHDHNEQGGLEDNILKCALNGVENEDVVDSKRTSGDKPIIINRPKYGPATQ